MTDNTLEELRNILIGQEKQRLEQVQAQLENRDFHQRSVAGSLPAAIRCLEREGDELSRALQGTVESAIRESIRRDYRRIADILFPVMGPAIRHAIRESFSVMLQSTQRMLDQSFSAQGLRWRLESWRSGTPFHEIVLSHTLVFRVEEVLLIHRPSGLLIGHVAAEGVTPKDSDAVSAMLSVIQDFVRDSFADDGSELGTVEVGEQSVWLARGPHAVLATVVRGSPDLRLREVLASTIEEVHLQLADSLPEYSGDADAVTDVLPLLEDCLLHAEREQDGKRRLSPLLWAMPLAIAIALAWWGYQRHQQTQQEAALQQRLTRFVAELNQQPGLLVIASSPAAEHFHIQGMRDPLAPDPKMLARNAGIDPATLRFSWTPYFDLDPRYVLPRARQALAPPQGVTLTLEDGMLIARGDADSRWIKRAAVIAPGLYGISGYDASELRDRDKTLLERIRAQIAPPTTVRLSIENGQLTISGHAPLAWIDRSENLLSGMTGLQGWSGDDLKASEWEQVAAAERHINKLAVYFEQGLEPAEQQDAMINALAVELLRLGKLAATLSFVENITITGHTDAIGDMGYNSRLRQARAHFVYSRLVDLGVPGANLKLETALPQLWSPNLVSGRKVSFSTTRKPLAKASKHEPQP